LYCMRMLTMHYESDLDLSDFILAVKVACRTLARRRGRALRLA
jgi:hypothetical protein